MREIDEKRPCRARLGQLISLGGIKKLYEIASIHIIIINYWIRFELKKKRKGKKKVVQCNNSVRTV
jgi:hypothetical protein